jgi:glycosyltransferase involved in cell wall biosynthesis
MRVLHLIARLNVGGTARYITRLAKDMPGRGIETSVATGYVQGEETEDPTAEFIDVIRVASLGRAINPLKDLPARNEFLKIIEKVQPDVLHTHTFKAGVIGRARISQIYRAAGKELKFVHTFHGHLFDDPEFSSSKNWAITALERRYAMRTNTLVTVGEQVSKDLLQREVGNPNQYLNIPPGVNPLLITPRQQAFANLNLEDDGRIVIGWIARVTGVKNPLRALEVACAIPEAHFVMAGGGDLLETIRAAAPSNVTVLGWADARDVFGVSDIVLSTSENEGMPIALIEAQLAGKPVVATNVGAVAEVIANGDTGYVVAKQTIDLVAAIKKLINDPHVRERFGVMATIRATSLFSVERMINAHYELYQSLRERD